MTQEQVADLAGIRQGHVSALELGKMAEPSYHTIDRLARALQSDPKTIYEAIQATIAA